MVAISLDEVVEHFSKTAPPKRKLALGINDGPEKKTKKVKRKQQEQKEVEVEVEEGNKFETKKKRTNAPFRRVVAETIEVNPNLTDNSANSSFDTWGAKVRTEFRNKGPCSLIMIRSCLIRPQYCQATADLIVTRGKSFRHEKTKKKRGSYKGGPINTGVASFKFED